MEDKIRPNHIYILDDLRGIAIILVLIYHYFFVYYRQINIDNILIQNFKLFNDYINLGVFGVSLFFLVSGFVIPMSLKGNNKKSVVSNFFIRRFFRLYPTYWVVIIMISTIILLFQNSDAYTLKQIMINFTMLQDIFRIDSIDGVFWTLMVELKFYILTAFLFYFGILKNISLVIIFFFLLSIVTIIDWGEGFNPIINAILNRNNLWSYMMLMYLGTAFYFYYIKKITKNILTILVVIVSVYFFSNHYFLSNSGFGDRLGYSISTLLAILSFIFFLQYNQMLSKVTTFFGNISYSLYLFHQVLGYFLISSLLKLNINIPFAQFIVILIMTLIAVFVNKYIEIPSNKYGHKYVK